METFLLSILAAVSSNYNNEIGELRTRIDVLNIEIQDLKTITIPPTIVPPVTEATTTTVSPVTEITTALPPVTSKDD